MRENDDRGQLERERLRTVMAFFIFGTSIYAFISLGIVAAQDILAGTFIQTSMVFVAFLVPNFLIALIVPYFMQKISYFVRIIAFTLALISGFLILVLVKQIHWKLIGVGIAAFGVGVGEITFIAFTSFYHEVTSSAFSAGTGVGFALGPLYYTGRSCQSLRTVKALFIKNPGGLFNFRPYERVTYYRGGLNRERERERERERGGWGVGVGLFQIIYFLRNSQQFSILY